jgi:CzcA family heavy metal efflux pump
MLQGIVNWSLQNRVITVALAILLLAAGIIASIRARLDVFPEFAPPQVVIQTESPGLSPLEVEQLVTLPIEQGVNGLPGLSVLRSQSIQGLSVVTVIFQDSTDIYRDRQLVTERLAELAGHLPEGVKTPKLGPLTPTTGRLLTVGFTSELTVANTSGSSSRSLLQLRDRITRTVRPRLLAVPGVAYVTVLGGEVRQFQVQVHPDYLAAHNLTLTDILEATRQATGIRGAGFLENDSQRLIVRVDGQIHTAADLARTVVTTSEGTPVRLDNVATVTEGPEPKFGDASINGKHGMILAIYKQLGSDTPETTQRVEAELERLKPQLATEGIAYHPALFRQTNFIDHAVGNVTQSLLIGAALVAVVLFLFLFNLRTAFISLTAIPLSLLGAVLVLGVWGIGLNTLTLGGLAIAVGEVVDDAIIDVENIFRRLRENERNGHPRSTMAVVLGASIEVRSAVVFATFIVVLVFIPVFFMTGLQGRLFSPLGYAYVLAVMASLLVALTVTPVLSMVLLPRASGAEEPPLLRALQRVYDRVVRVLDRELALVLTTTLVLVVAAVYGVFQFGGEFLPELRENHFVMHMRGIPGTSLSQSMAAGERVTHFLRQNPDIVSVAQQAGRAELGEDTMGVEYNELEVDLKRLGAVDVQKIKTSIDEETAGKFPGFTFETMPFLTERIKETIHGSTAAVAIKIFGDDLIAIDKSAQDIAGAVRRVKGSVNVRVEAQVGAPEIVVRIRPGDAARHGLRNVQILDAVHAAYQGAELGQAYEANQIIDLVVILDATVRNDPESVANLWLTAPAGRLQLKQVADIFLSDGRFLIAHEGGLRRQQVSCNVSSRDIDSFVAEAERAVQALTLPSGVSYTFTGEHEAKAAAQREIRLWSMAVLAGIVLFLWMVFASVRCLVLVLFNSLFALAGGVAAVYLSGGILNVGSLVGFVTLFGITMRNGIMMVSHWEHLHEVEGMPRGPELVFRGARERLGPVLMTALVTALGLLPIALGSGEAGREIEGPMALVILGGLVASTAMTLLVLPVLYRRFGNSGRMTPANI